MIYLDCAATTMQKPPSVAKAVGYAVNHMTTPGRGTHSAAMLAAETVYNCREAAAKLFSVAAPENIVFTCNATHGLNIAIKSLVNPGDRVVTSGYEHNAVSRALRAAGAVVAVARSELFEPEAAVKAFESKINRKTSAVVCNHVSNVFGYVLPIERVAGLCAAYRVPLIIDASQSAGCLNLNSSRLGADFIAMPGHKGLYGPQGTGILICNSPCRTLIEGGTGSISASDGMPEFLPDRLEAGTHNIPGIAGLLEGIRFITRKGTGPILAHEKSLISEAVEGLSKIIGVRVFSAGDISCQTGVLSFLIPGIDCELIAEELGKEDIAVRAGLHCAPAAHRVAGTFDTGTVRISTSAFNTHYEIDKLLKAIHKISKRFV